MIGSINKRVIAIKNNNEQISLLIEEYTPFIISAASKILKRYVDYYNDEEYSIALMAFSEAIESYKVDRGDFLSFAHRLIKLRLIDNYRKQNRKKDIKFSGLEELEDDIKGQYIDRVSVENYKQEGIDYLRKLEIEQFSNELVEYGISFDDLIKVSPKWKSTKVLYNALIKEANSEVNADEYADKPVREIMKALNAKRAENRAEAKEIKKEAKEDKNSNTENNGVQGETEQASKEILTEEKVETKSLNKSEEKAGEKTAEAKEKTNNSSNDNKQQAQQKSSNGQSNSQEKASNAQDKGNNFKATDNSDKSNKK